LAFYTDKERLFTNAPGWDVERRGEPPKTQIRRALQELDIEWIVATVPRPRAARSASLALRGIL
jgi:hypothetical protein